MFLYQSTWPQMLIVLVGYMTVRISVAMLLMYIGTHTYIARFPQHSHLHAHIFCLSVCLSPPLPPSERVSCISFWPQTCYTVKDELELNWIYPRSDAISGTPNLVYAVLRTEHRHSHTDQASTPPPEWHPQTLSVRTNSVCVVCVFKEAVAPFRELCWF